MMMVSPGSSVTSVGAVVAVVAVVAVAVVVAGRVTSGRLVDCSVVVNTVTGGLVVADWLVSGCVFSFPTVGATGPVPGPGPTLPCVTLA